eukprot:UN02424
MQTKHFEFKIQKYVSSNKFKKQLFWLFFRIHLFLFAAYCAVTFPPSLDVIATGKIFPHKIHQIPKL